MHKPEVGASKIGSFGLHVSLVVRQDLVNPLTMASLAAQIAGTVEKLVTTEDEEDVWLALNELVPQHFTVVGVTSPREAVPHRVV